MKATLMMLLENEDDVCFLCRYMRRTDCFETSSISSFSWKLAGSRPWEKGEGANTHWVNTAAKGD